VETAADYFSALDKVNDYDYDCILLDIMLPGGSGLFFQKGNADCFPQIRFVFYNQDFHTGKGNS